MTITDLNGLEIEITDLIAAIDTTAMFKEYRHKDPGSANQIRADDQRQRYWTDLHKKLLQLQKE